MKNSNSSITADSRHTPRTHHNPSHGASPVSTPQALLTSWIGQIENMPVNGAFGGLATQQVDRWKKAFDVELKRHADAIAEAPQAQLDINHRKALKKTTFPHREVKDEVAADTTTTTTATTTTTNTSSTAVSTPRQTPRTRTSRGDQEKPRS